MKKLNYRIAATPDSRGRVAIVRSVSMQPEDWEYVHRRVAELHPRVKDRSHFFQLLLKLEQTGMTDVLAHLSSGSSREETSVEKLAEQLTSVLAARRRRS